MNSVSRYKPAGPQREYKKLSTAPGIFYLEYQAVGGGQEMQQCIDRTAGRIGLAMEKKHQSAGGTSLRMLT